MEPVLFAGPANRDLGDSVARELGVPPGGYEIDRFPDGELHVRVDEAVRGAEVYLVQPVSPPAETRLLELLLLADACRLTGAARVTAVVPYLGYARQDRRSGPGEPLGARLVASLLGVAGLHRVVVVDLHQPAIESAFAVPVEQLTAVPLLVDAVRPELPPGIVVVSPDLGAARLADHYARLLGAPTAVVHKRRLSGSEVSVVGVVGEVRGLAPLIVDDMITTGGTIRAAVRALLEAGCREEIFVVATHAVLAPPSADRLRELPLRRLLATDSVAPSPGFALRLERVRLAPLLADAIGRLHHGRSLDALLRHG